MVNRHLISVVALAFTLKHCWVKYSFSSHFYKAMNNTNGLLTTALHSHLHNGVFKHGPHGFHASNFLVVREMFLEVGVGDPTTGEGGARQTFLFLPHSHLCLPSLSGGLPCDAIQFIDQLTAPLQYKLIFKACKLK